MLSRNTELAKRLSCTLDKVPRKQLETRRPPSPISRCMVRLLMGQLRMQPRTVYKGSVQAQGRGFRTRAPGPTLARPGPRQDLAWVHREGNEDGNFLVPMYIHMISEINISVSFSNHEKPKGKV